MTQRMNVGFIGLGNIGKPCAMHLISEAFNVHVFDISEQACKELEIAGANICPSVAELANNCEHIGICVRDDAQVETLLYGDDGIFSNAQTGSRIAIHSTVTHASMLRWADDAQAHQLNLFDAAISGGANGAENATLCYMVGGDEDTINLSKAVFETSADKIVHAGKIGSGLLLKLCNNLITYAEFMAMSEATKLAEAGGLSIDMLREVGESNGIINETMHMFISSRNALATSCSEEEMQQMFGPFGKLSEKDLDSALGSAAELNVELPSTQALRVRVYDMFLNKA